MLQAETNQQIIKQINRLICTLHNISETKMLMIIYVLETQNLYCQTCQKMKSEIEEFQTTIYNQSFYSMKKCESMNNLVKAYKNFIMSLEGLSKINTSEIKRIEFTFLGQQKKILEKANSFIEEINKYKKYEQVFNSKYEEYEVQCEKFNERLNKFRIYEHPIKFYNFHIVSEFVKKLDLKFQKCQNLQVQLLSYLVFLDEKRRFINASLEQFQDDYLLLIHRHFENIESLTKILTDQSKDQVFNKMNENHHHSNLQSEIIEEEIKRFTFHHHQEESEDYQFILNFKPLLSQNSQNVSISSDYKLFIHRCQSFCEKKSKIIDETIYLQKKALKQIQIKAKLFQNLSEDFRKIQKEIFKSYGMTNFKKRFTKYFGINFSAMVEMCEGIVQNPRIKLQKVSKNFQANQEKLKKIILEKEEQLKTFKKRTGVILSQQKNVRKQLSNLSLMPLVKAKQFQANVEKSSKIFENIIQEFDKIQKNIDSNFDSLLKKLIDFTNTQKQHCFLKYFLGKEKQKYTMGILQKLSINNEVISIVKQDHRYDVLFKNVFPPTLFENFQSLIKKKNYQETKQILQKKQYQERHVNQEQNAFCFGLSKSRKIVKVNKFSQHTGFLIDVDETQKNGIIEIFSKGISFQEQSINPFYQKIQIMIPLREIVDFCQKKKDMKEIIQVTTNMGPIEFISEQNNQILESLEKNVRNKISTKDPQRKSRNSQGSSFIKNLNSSTEFKVSFQPSLSSPGKSFPPKNSEKLNLQQLVQKWMQKSFFSSLFKPINHDKNKNRQDYQYGDEFNRFIVKEKKEGRVSGALNYVFFDFLWKVSFPETPMMSSFQHSESIRIEIGKNVIKVIIIEKKREQETLFAHKKFYNQVDILNHNVSDFISEYCERDTEVLMQIDGKEENSFQFEESLLKQSNELDMKPRFSRQQSSSNISI